MKKHVLLFDSDCAACSKVARAVQELAVTDLEVLTLRDAQVAGALSQAGLAAPDRPSLLVTGDDDDDDVRLLSGWSMRRRLVGMVGWWRARTITRLLISEWRARRAREAPLASPSRRRAIGTAVAGVAGWAMLPRLPGAGRPAVQETSYAPAAEADVQRALASEPVRRAIRTWGQFQPQAMEVTEGSERILAFFHGEGDGEITTVVDNSADARLGAPMSLSMGKSPSVEHGIRFYTVDGVPLSDIKIGADGKLTVMPLTQQSNVNNSVPDAPGFSIGCWLICMQGMNIYPSPGCEAACNACFDLLGANIVCAHCLACAGGVKAVTCARRCQER
jgi:predicted DCC family thiol-disulfide oxidoreductase YuxK